MAEGGESMTLDDFLKVLTPYSDVEIVVLAKDTSHSVNGYKMNVIQDLIQDGYSSFEDYEIYSISLTSGIIVDSNGSDDKTVNHIHVIAKEKY